VIGRYRRETGGCHYTRAVRDCGRIMHCDPDTGPCDDPAGPQVLGSQLTLIVLGACRHCLAEWESRKDVRQPRPSQNMAKSIDPGLVGVVAFVMIAGGLAHLGAFSNIAALVPAFLPALAVSHSAGFLPTG
jgi:hypothetical protein